MKIVTSIINMFRPVGIEVLIANELEEARRELLKAMTARDYFHATILYHRTRIERLTEENQA